MGIGGEYVGIREFRALGPELLKIISIAPARAGNQIPKRRCQRWLNPSAPADEVRPAVCRVNPAG